ncbi:MAG: DNA-3-methyladenine glycosylase [Elusimicrobiota bacterium]
MDFFNRSTGSVAKSLLDKYLISETNGEKCGGRIIETEAYFGDNDMASHAYGGITPRNKLMYGNPGRIYVYIIYGIHYCLNVVCEKKGIPGAVLIRSIEPEIGIEAMKERRKNSNISVLTSGPGKLTQALGINMDFNGKKVNGKKLYFLDNKDVKRPVQVSRRIGISKSKHIKARYFIKNSKFVSKVKL